MNKIVEAANTVADKTYPPHPYYPLNAQVANYLANEWSVPVLLGYFFGGCAALFSLTLLVVKRVHPNLPTGEKACILWFVLSGTIHVFFEGYFASHHASLGGSQTLLGQLWKEYAFSDSRYLTSDPFVLCMETVTAVCWGPLSYLTAWFITTQHPLRHPFQMLVSIGQIYGLILYYATSMFDLYFTGTIYSRPEPFYFWFYFFFMNFIWMVIPGWLVVNSFNATSRAFVALEKMNKGRQGNGSAGGSVKKSN